MNQYVSRKRDLLSTNDSTAKLLECVTLEGVRQHQAALQEIANANGGTRVSATPGYDRSVDYVAGKLRDAGYVVTLQPVNFQTFVYLSPTVLAQVTPGPAGPVANNILAYSGSGDVTAVVSVPSLATGCNAADFAGFPAGHIALISRGTCSFAIKATNAFNAGAAGVVIYNNAAGELNGDRRPDVILSPIAYGVGTFGSPFASFTCGLGYGFTEGDFADNPVIVLGGEAQLSNSVAHGASTSCGR